MYTDSTATTTTTKKGNIEWEKISTKQSTIEGERKNGIRTGFFSV